MVAPTSRSIPSLDGLRAYSVLLVVAAHSLEYMRGNPGVFPFVQLGTLALLGVDTFFVISGFLISRLLLKELNSKGSIRLRTFYFRRFFRIFPPFYAYLAVVAILWAAGLAHVDRWAIPYAGLYIWDYAMRPGSWLVGHTWSLSLEEQFYVLWPPVLALLGKRRSMYAAFGVILLSPLVRLISYFVYPPWRFQVGMLLHTRLDTIMFGCVLALLWDNQRFQRAVESVLRPELFGCCILYLMVVSPLIEPSFRPRFSWLIGYTLHGLLIALVLLYVVKKPLSLPGRALNYGPVRHIGVISYSLYLWQQMFAGPHGLMFPLNVVPIFVCAELSYWLIERPSFRVRDMFELRFAKPRSAMGCLNEVPAVPEMARTQTEGV